MIVFSLRGLLLDFFRHRLNLAPARLGAGEKGARVSFSNKVLIELSRPSVPKTARDEAEQYEKLTVKQAKDLVNAHKRIKELESVREPNLDNLIPELHKKYKGSSITIGRANRLSVLDEKQQKMFLSLLGSKDITNKKNDKLSEEKLRLLEAIEKTSRERDEVKEQLKELENSDTGTILLEKEQALKEARADYDRRLIEIRKTASKEASELHETLNKEKIERAHEEKFSALRDKRQAQEKASAAYQEQTKLESKIKKLEEQLEVDNPTNVDNARVTHIEDAGRGLLISFNELRKDMDRIGGGMEASLSIAKEILKDATLKLAELQGSQDAIINI